MEEWHSYPELGAQADSPLIPTIVKQIAERRGFSAEFVSSASVRVYCSKERWVSLLVEVARRIYRDEY